MNSVLQHLLAGAGLLAAVYATVALVCRAPEDTLLGVALRPFCEGFVLLVHRFVVFPGKDVVPRAGPAILVANHRSGLDPLLVAVATRRRVHFLMAREYYEVPGLTWAFRALGCIPVNRDGNDLGATKAALKALHAGHVIGIFPQGGIRETAEALEGKAGVALLALRSGAPVVPYYIQGSPALDSVFLALFTPSRSRIFCGSPFSLEPTCGRPTRADIEARAAIVFDAISRLRPIEIPRPQGRA